MSETIVGSYATEDQLKNTREELTAKGIPQDKVVVDDDRQVIEVVAMPTVTKPEIEEIFQRHGIRPAT